MIVSSRKLKQVETVYVTLTPRDRGKHKRIHFAIYNATPEQVLQIFRRAEDDLAKQSESDQPAVERGQREQDLAASGV